MPPARRQPRTPPLQRRIASPPAARRLRVFAVDPGTTARFETALLNETVVEVPWEELDPGPYGEHLQVVDRDDTGAVQNAVDLDSRTLLAECGLSPCDGDPQFRQQMVYAVAMKTIHNFERSLGRRTHWAATEKGRRRPYRRTLTLYPAYRESFARGYERAEGIRFGYGRSPYGATLPGTLSTPPCHRT